MDISPCSKPSNDFVLRIFFRNRTTKVPSITIGKLTFQSALKFKHRNLVERFFPTLTKRLKISWMNNSFIVIPSYTYLVKFFWKILYIFMPFLIKIFQYAFV